MPSPFGEIPADAQTTGRSRDHQPEKSLPAFHQVPVAGLLEEIVQVNRPGEPALLKEPRLTYPPTLQSRRVSPRSDTLLCIGLENASTLSKEAQVSGQGGQRWAKIAGAGKTGLWDWDLRTNKVSFSPECKSSTRYRQHDFSTSRDEWESRVHPDDLSSVKESIADFLAHPQGRAFHNAPSSVAFGGTLRFCGLVELRTRSWSLCSSDPFSVIQ